MTTKTVEIGFQGQRIEWDGLADYLTRTILSGKPTTSRAQPGRTIKEAEIFQKNFQTGQN
ncbi:hypothetical protein [Magnetospirillum molischianum]|uniref:Uncharacterized protein n=1 Tax=Magnetospirillum molischianum DSM 120 TaxID=1150626 RepID=H8FWW3_MAGML|nr:hypothetical protein [Magnetospirillum molischianum]CCG42851.1 hypothetical protein PHAMO_490014 [Magnetospirillum molischianum DSM 120]